MASAKERKLWKISRSIIQAGMVGYVGARTGEVWTGLAGAERYVREWIGMEGIGRRGLDRWSREWIGTAGMVS